MKKLLTLLLLTSSVELYAQSFVAPAPKLDLKAYILIEPQTGTVIAEYNSDDRIEPASMTKIMTSYIAADQITNNDNETLSDKVKISEKHILALLPTVSRCLYKIWTQMWDELWTT